MIFTYKGCLYPDYLKNGGASRYIEAIAKEFCRGYGIDVGCGAWPLPGAVGFDIKALAHDQSKWSDAAELKVADVSQDYIFSSHCLEHVENYVKVLEHWKSKIKPGGVLYLYLPHPDMEYWLPQNNRKHIHSFTPSGVHKLLLDLGFIDVVSSERDMYWSFSVVGFVPPVAQEYL